MADLTVKENTTIIIKKNKGITHALRDYVKKNPNSILSDGKITAKEWNAVLDTLIDINNSRKTNNQKPIFTGGTDKSRAGWHSSFVFHPNQKIEFTAEEMSALYSAMGVTLKSSENSDNASEQKVESNPDSTVVTQPDKQDTIPALKADTVLKEPVVEDSSKKSRYELSWGEIGKISLKSAKNFVKGMFCDENGFSLKRTAATVGVVAGLALTAPVAAAAGASAAVVGGVALAAKVAGLGLAGVMAYNGGKNAIEGGIKYYNSTTEEEAKANMEQAMDGAVEAAAALPAFFAIKGGANKGNKIAQNKASQKPPVEEAPKAEAKPAEVKPAEAPKAEVKPAESNSAQEVKPLEDPIQLTDEPAPKTEPKSTVETKPAENVKPAEAPKAETNYEELKPERTEINKYPDGTTMEAWYDENGNIIKSIYRDKNGQFDAELVYEYNSNGERVKYIWRSSYNDIAESFYENGIETRRIWKWHNGWVDELTSSNGSDFNGVRTYPDGRKVAIELKQKWRNP